MIAGGAPAGGATLQEMAIGIAVGMAGVVAVALVSRAYPRGGARWLRWASRTATRVSGLPAWASLPAAVCGGSLLIAVLGFYWDVATHIDSGRDDGPFANPAHYLIFAGLVGIALAGWLSALLSEGDATPPSAIRLVRGRSVPLGGALMLLCGSVALAAFPLDDLWHRLFGQDVTLWGPTHVLMVGGASLSTLGMWVLWSEGRSVTPARGPRRTFAERAEVLIAGAFLLGLSSLQGEFDFGVPQFRLLYHPILVALAASIGLIAARVRLGPWGAVKAVVMFLAVRGTLSLLVGPVFGRIALHFPLFLVAAGLVELAATSFAARGRTNASFGAIAGGAVGTVGLAAEWAWSHLWMPIPWPAELLPEAAVLGAVAGVAGGVIGGLIGGALSGEVRASRRPWVAVGAVTIAAACLAYPAPIRQGDPVLASVRLEGAGSGEATVRVTLAPAGAAEDAAWFHVLAWQGLEGTRGSSVLAPLREDGRGGFRTEEPVPVGGSWKTILRLHVDDRLLAVPIHLPADPGIPAPAVPAPPSFERPLGPDKAIIQREAVTTSVGLQRVGYAVLLAVALAWLAALGAGLSRLATAGRRAIAITA